MWWAAESTVGKSCIRWLAHWRHLANVVQLCATAMSGSIILPPGIVMWPVPKLLGQARRIVAAFYRTMHYSAKRSLRSHDVVCLSVRLSVTLVDHDHIG